MVCPGQDPNDPYLPYALGTNNQFKCYDGFHLWNQVQPAVFDGYYAIGNDVAGMTPIPAGNYVVEMVPPPGYEIVKEEDKNILIGDQWVAPPAQQFGGLSNIFILPDQASLAAAYNPANPAQQPDPGARLRRRQAVLPDLRRPAAPGARLPEPVPDLGPGRAVRRRDEGAVRPQGSGAVGPEVGHGANFFVFTNDAARLALHRPDPRRRCRRDQRRRARLRREVRRLVRAGVDPKDFNGVEISRVYSDQWGTYNGLTPSTWQVNVPNPAGYSPNMLVTCMNDPGPILDTDPAVDRRSTR